MSTATVCHHARLTEAAAVAAVSGNFTAALRTAGRWEDALLIITSDNGGIGPGNNCTIRPPALSVPLCSPDAV